MKTILEMLAPGEYVSGEAISRVLGVSRAAVWKKISALREAGCAGAILGRALYENAFTLEEALNSLS